MNRGVARTFGGAIKILVERVSIKKCFGERERAILCASEIQWKQPLKGVP